MKSHCYRGGGASGRRGSCIYFTGLSVFESARLSLRKNASRSHPVSPPLPLTLLMRLHHPTSPRSVPFSSAALLSPTRPPACSLARSLLFTLHLFVCCFSCRASRSSLPRLLAFPFLLPLVVSHLRLTLPPPPPRHTPSHPRLHVSLQIFMSRFSSRVRYRFTTHSRIPSNTKFDTVH